VAPEPARVAVLELAPSEDWPRELSERPVLGVHLTLDTLRDTVPVLIDADITHLVLRIDAQGASYAVDLEFSRFVKEVLEPRWDTIIWLGGSSWGSWYIGCASERLFVEPDDRYEAFFLSPGHITWGPGQYEQRQRLIEWTSAASPRDRKLLLAAMDSYGKLSFTLTESGERIWRADLEGTNVVHDGKGNLHITGRRLDELGFVAGSASSFADFFEKAGIADAEIVETPAQEWLNEEWSKARTLENAIGSAFADWADWLDRTAEADNVPLPPEMIQEGQRLFRDMRLAFTANTAITNYLTAFPEGQLQMYLDEQQARLNELSNPPRGDR
jgi:hypothetical protein